MSTSIPEDFSASESEDLYVVGIGASAGGLRSIEVLFDHMPSDTGMAFVIIQHLSPDFKSLMTEILTRHTEMPVVLATTEMSLRPNHIFVIPPGKELRCFSDTIAISEMPAGLNRPIDTFFNSLAKNKGVSSVGVILSGTGTDGAQGVQAIHAAGGLTISESVETAQFDGMPVSAQRTGSVDLTLRPEEIALALDRYRNNQNMSIENFSSGQKSGLELIYSLLESGYGLRFDQYKPTTIARRIERRQSLGGFPSIKTYADHLETDDAELDSLFHDLLIGVTKFFRDDKAYLSLEKTVSEFLPTLSSDETFRVWSVGCATGEEPYSIAMIILDAMDRLGRPRELKVFATDVHQGSLDRAAKGEFDAESIEFVSPGRRQKYFEQLDSGRFRVKQSLRKHLVFATHNAIQDASFTKIHLVSCRNVLIYFRKRAQDITLASFHLSLVKGGILFLGASETLGELESEFLNVDQKWRIFKKIRDRRELISRVTKVRQLPKPIELDQTNSAASPSSLTINAVLDVYDTLIQSRIAVGLLLDRNQRVIHAIGNVSRILKGASGPFRGIIGDFLEPQAKTTITAALIRSQREPGTDFVLENIQPDDEQPELYQVTVTALESTANHVIGWVIQFEPSEKEPVKTIRVTGVTDDAYDMLESELQFTKESLSASVEELETSNEEMQATNEEMVASNEELQSTNEELHSVNEELHSVNAELNRKIAQLEESTNDLEMLLGSSDVGTIFLDSELRIRKFTQAITRYFNLLPLDMGRCISDFSCRLGVKNLQKLLRDVIKKGDAMTIDVIDEYGAPAYVKIVPYRFGEVISGAVLTVIVRPEMSSDLRRMSVRGRVGNWEWPDAKKDEMWWSPTCYQLLGLSSKTPSLMSQWRDRVHPEDDWQLIGTEGVSCPFSKNSWMRIRMRCADEVYRYFEFQGITHVSDGGDIVGMSGFIATSNLVVTEYAEVNKRIELLEKSLSDYQDYAQAVSQDLQTPLRDIQSAVQSLTKVTGEDAVKSEEERHAVLSRCDHLSSMITSLVDYSHINTHGSKMVPCNTTDLITSAVSEFNDRMKDSQASIDVKPLPDVVGDPEQLKQLFWHLIDNSLKYRDGGVSEICVQSESCDSPNQVAISVRDNGVGIAARHLNEIFIIFRRLGNAKNVPGAGLGLALCKRIVQRHGGWIWAESQMENGTTIHLRLPKAMDG